MFDIYEAINKSEHNQGKWLKKVAIFKLNDLNNLGYVTKFTKN